MKTQLEVIQSLPVHLQPFVATQRYETYTPRDQAVWRFLMHQLVKNLSRTAHSLYLEGLAGTGIDVESIPKIEVMNDKLEAIGWRAAVVDGFIPPAIFIEFLAHRVLVVAVDIRSYEHMLYTPAPDIIHESAGHAPFIIDVDYAEYLERVGNFGRRVISNKGDIEVYEAIRHLSIVKESPTSSTDDVAVAEQSLQDAIDRHKGTPPSEAALLSRLQWWTTEYGLVGRPDDYKIFGAGLLSSLGESVNCLDDDKVKKIPLTIDAIATTYDITNEQPQLFVARNCRHLSQIADEFARSMSFFKGGTQALTTAIEAETVNTAVYNSGLEVSGQFTRIVKDAVGNTIYLNTTGPTQLAYKEKEIDGHGTDYHAHGFGSPVGKLAEMDRCLSSYSVDDLKRFGIAIGERVTLEYLSGITVVGQLTALYRRDGHNLIFTFEDCTVTDLKGNILFDPEWGTFDMAVGESIESVYGGSADQSTFPLYKKPSNTATVAIDYDASTQALFDVYAQIRKHRTVDNLDPTILSALTESVLRNYPEEWLLLFEVAELNGMNQLSDDLNSPLLRRLDELHQHADAQKAALIQYGLSRLSTRHH